MDTEHTICKLKKGELSHCIRQLAAEAHHVRYVCMKCGRLSPNKKNLCKGKSIQKLVKVES